MTPELPHTPPPSSPDEPPAPPPDADDADAAAEDASLALTLGQVHHALAHGVMVEEVGMMRWSSNRTYLVHVQHEGLLLPAVYKPRYGERPLWDFPDGTLCQRETAAFVTAQALGWELVPPTVLRDGKRGVGSVQFFIEHDPQMNYFAFDEAMLPQLARLALFDVIVNNADRKGGHMLLDAHDHLWAIDHGICFHREHKLRTVVWDFAGQPIPEALLADLTTLCHALDCVGGETLSALGELLAPNEIDMVRRRVQRLLERKKYPTPGPGPNYPWPLA